jgi:predicted transcriptional regulator of viral defense system
MMQMGQRKKQSSHEYNHSPTTLLVALFGGACAFITVESIYGDANDAGWQQMNRLPAWQVHMGSACVGIIYALFVELNERSKATFNLRDVEEITGLRGSSARTLIHKAEKRGVVTRLCPGLYNLVPFELGRATEYVGDPYVIARELCGGQDYFLSYASAMELHRMVTQPQLTLYVSSTLRKPTRTIHGYEYHFVAVKPKQYFGLTQFWITKQQAVMVSDRERTIADGLRHPQYAGGVPEVAKALWMSRSEINIPRLLEYRQRFQSGALPGGSDSYWNSTKWHRRSSSRPCAWCSVQPMTGSTRHSRKSARIRRAGVCSLTLTPRNLRRFVTHDPTTKSLPVGEPAA